MPHTPDRQLHLMRMKRRTSDRTRFRRREQRAVGADGIDGGAGDVEEGEGVGV